MCCNSTFTPQFQRNVPGNSRPAFHPLNLLPNHFHCSFFFHYSLAHEGFFRHFWSIVGPDSFQLLVYFTHDGEYSVFTAFKSSDRPHNLLAKQQMANNSNNLMILQCAAWLGNHLGNCNINS